MLVNNDSTKRHGLFKENLSTRRRIPSYLVLDRKAPRDIQNNPNYCHFVVCSQLNSKTLLLKTLHTYALGHKRINLELPRKHCWVAFIDLDVHEMAKMAT